MHSIDDSTDKQRAIYLELAYVLHDYVIYIHALSMAVSRCLTEEELFFFRTQPCVNKALKRECPNEDDCPHSHCVSWSRRNPAEITYRPGLCSFVIFQRDQNQTRVKNFCNRGRYCPHAHTKEEQMYHPMVYKTKLCRGYPQCSRVYCPFGMLKKFSYHSRSTWS